MSASAASMVWPVHGCKEALVCGLWWHTVLGKAAAQRARRLARQHKAPYLAQDVARPEGVGLWLSRSMPSLTAGVTYYSAALTLASMYPKGVVLVCLQLATQQWWVAGVQEGKVLQATDRILEREEDRDALLRSLIERFGSQCRLCGDGHDEAEEVFSFDAVLAHRHAAHQLKRVLGPRWPSGLRGLLLVGSVAGLTVVLRLGWDHGMPRKSPPDEAVSQADTAPPPLPPDVRFAAQTWVLPPSAWPVLLDELTALPLWLGGWRFQHAQCAPQQRRWTCQVQYARIHAWASNQTFWEAKPAAWRLEWQPMESVVAHVELTVQGVELELETLLTRNELDTSWVSRLQQHQQRWQAIALGPWQRAWPEGREPETTVVLHRGVSVQAALQHLQHFPLESQGAWSWQHVQVTLHPQAEAHRLQALLQAQLKGVSYARR